MTSSLYIDSSLLLTRKGLDDRVCIREENRAITWIEFLREVNGWKLAFEAAGVKRVALYSKDLFSAASQMFGAWAAGVVTVLPADASPAICALLADGVVDACAGDFADGCGMPKITKIETQEPCRDAFNPKLQLVELFTSGSTGVPSRIEKRLEQLFVEVESIELRNHGLENTYGEDVRIISTVSQQHIYGLLFYLLWPFASAREVWGYRLEYPEQVLDLFGRLGDCVWISSPAHLKRLPEHLDWASVKEHIRGVNSSGGPLPEEGLRLCLSLLGVSPTEFLGSSEAGGIAWRNRQIRNGEISEVQWKALPSVEWRCENGLLAIKSPQLLSSGWEIMTDKIIPNDDGETFTHIGRTDRIVKIEEKRVSLTQVESTLEANPLVAQAKALQISDARHSFSIVAVPSAEGVALIKAEGKRALVKVLKEALAQTLETVCLPRYWRFVSSLPENSMGKVTVSALNEMFVPTAVQAVAEMQTPDEASWIVTVPSNSPFFKGHFPGFAILPGLTQVEWLVDLIEKSFPVKAENFKGMNNLKFMKPIAPEETLVVTLKYNEAKSSVSFVINSNAGETHAKGGIVF